MSVNKVLTMLHKSWDLPIQLNISNVSVVFFLKKTYVSQKLDHEKSFDIASERESVVKHTDSI